jgi:hypothetical protein
MFLLHKCDNPPCFNPEHLYEGTGKDNCRDMFLRGRANRQRGEKSPNVKLTESDVRQIRIKHQIERKTYDSLGKEYGMSLPAIQSICNRRTWKHVI